MNLLDWVLAVVAASALAFAAIVFFHSRCESRRVLDSINAMLEAAENGSFSETRFDESLLSAAETRMAQFLQASEVSTKNLSGEKAQIKQLIGDISHQTKTPLANLLLYTQLLEEQTLPPESAVCVKALDAQVEKLTFLIDALVKLSRLEAGVFTLMPKASPVQALLDQVSAQLLPKAEEKCVALSVCPTETAASFDPKWTMEALYNIADNAVKYTPAGGSIRISAAVFELFVRVDISDTGIGIAESEQAKIFTRFYRSPAVSEAEGVGIGLYLARQILSGEGGYIKVRSTLGEGSCFSVFLPRK